MNRTDNQTALAVVVDGAAAADWSAPLAAAGLEPTLSAGLEPTLSVGQVAELLRAAADLERSRRPIVLHTAPAPATRTAAAHPGITVTVPAAPVDLEQHAPTRRLFTRAELVFACGVTSAISTLAAGIAAAVANSPMPLAAAAVVGIGTSVGAAVTMTGDDDREQLRAWRERRGGATR